MAVVGSMLAAAPLLAQDAQSLTITGPDGAVVASLDLAALDAMAQSEFTTTTIWTDGPVLFSGVALSTVLDSAGVTGTTLTMTALNDYAVDMPVSEITEDAPIIATRMDGEPMSVRDKGPFWVVYDYDSDTAFQTEAIFAQSIWQLNRLTLME
jgi:hypothetical protein